MLCLIQARVSTKWFIKKMFKRINEKLTLEIIIERFKLSKKISEIKIINIIKSFKYQIEDYV